MAAEGRRVRRRKKHPSRRGLKSLPDLLRRSRPSQVALLIAVTALAFILGTILSRYTSDIYNSWRHKRHLASAALRFGRLNLARKALDHVPASLRDRAAFHVFAGWLARAEGNYAGQEEQFAAAVKKEPENDLYQFNLAVLRIRSPDPEKNA